MKSSKLVIKGCEKASLVDYLIRSKEFEYVDDTPDLTILAGEEYWLIMSSNQMYVITLKQAEDAVDISLIIGGGDAGVFGLGWGEGKAFLKSAKRKIKEYCEVYNLEYSELI